MRKQINAHDVAVTEFFKSCKDRDPERYEKTCQRYPTVSANQWRRIRERELRYNEAVEEQLFGTDDVDEEY